MSIVYLNLTFLKFQNLLFLVFANYSFCNWGTILICLPVFHNLVHIDVVLIQKVIVIEMIFVLLLKLNKFHFLHINLIIDRRRIRNTFYNWYLRKESIPLRRHRIVIWILSILKLSFSLLFHSYACNFLWDAFICVIIFHLLLNNLIFKVLSV